MRYGKKPRGRSVRDRLQRHVNTTLANAGDYAELKEAIVRAITDGFGDIMLNLTLNNSINGYALNQYTEEISNQKGFSNELVG